MELDLAVNKLEVVDSHHHFWDLSLGWHDWLLGEPKPFLLGDYTALRRNYLPDDYAIDAFGVDVLATVHVQSATGVRCALYAARQHPITFAGGAANGAHYDIILLAIGAMR